MNARALSHRVRVPRYSVRATRAAGSSNDRQTQRKIKERKGKFRNLNKNTFFFGFAIADWQLIEK